MKKFFAALITGMLFLQFTVCVGAASIVAVDGRPTVEAKMGTVTIDGEVDDAWANANMIVLEGVFEGEKQEGIDYASCQVSLLWNGVNEMYLLYEVVDPLVCQASNEDYKNDTAEWYLDFDNYNTEDPAVDIAWHSYPEESFSGMDYAYTAMLTDNGYRVEVLVYLDCGNVTPTVGDYIGADFQINEDANDDGERDIAIRWSSWRSDFWQDSSEYGQVLLSAETIPGFTAPETSSTAETTVVPETSSNEETTALPETSAEESESVVESSSEAETTVPTTDKDLSKEATQNTWILIVIVFVVVIAVVVVLLVLRKKKIN